jgi:hypothetical protein
MDIRGDKEAKIGRIKCDPAPGNHIYSYCMRRRFESSELMKFKEAGLDVMESKPRNIPGCSK